MKKILLLFAFNIIIIGLYAQTPQVFKYQTVVRDAAGAVYANKIVSFRISILRDNPTGTSVYVETHNTTTNDFGIVNLNIGSGNVVSGSFGAIDWGMHEHFVKTEIDMLGGTDFQFMGTSQLLSVPYALFAGKSANAADDFDKDSTNEIQTISEIGNNVTLSNNGGSFTDSDNQTLTLNGTQLQISNGNYVNIGGTVDLDWDPNNELQNLSLSGDSLKISMGSGVLLPHDDDNDSTNELQTLTKVGSTITLSGGGGSVTDIDTDTDNQNLSSTANGTQRTINITGGTGTTFNIADNDNSTTNELQTLTYSNNTLSISSGNSVTITTVNDMAIFEEQTESGGYPSYTLQGGAWTTRTLDTTIYNVGSNISRNADTIILQAGVYYINASAPATNCTHRIKLWNITDNKTELLGTSERAPNPSSVTSRSIIDGVISVNAQKKLLIKHFAYITTCSCGTASNSGENEVYTRVIIRKMN